MQRDTMQRCVGAFIVMLAACNTAWACKCLQPTEASVTASSDIALEGTVLKLRRVGNAGSGKIFATLRVNKAIKGKLPRTITVQTNMSPAACGISFTQGQSIRLGASRTGRNYSAGLCSVF